MTMKAAAGATMSSSSSKDGRQLLHIYMVAWSIHRIYEVIGAGNQTLGWHGTSQWMIVPLTAAALWTRSIRLWIMGSMLATAIADFSLMPFIWDSEYWCLLTDFAAIYALVATLGWKRVLWNGTKFTEEEIDSIYPQLSSTIQIQMMLFYTAAWFWKLNWDFLDANSSCAPIFAMQLLDHITPNDWVVPDWVLMVVVQSSPFLVLLLEGYIAYAFFTTRHSRAVLAAMLLHMGIAMCPPPSNVATFSLMCASRLVLFVPHGTVEACSLPANWSSLELSATVVLAAIAAKIADHEDFYDLAYPLFVLCSPFLIKAAVLTQSSSSSTSSISTTWKSAVKVPILLAFVYAYLCLVLGTMDQGQPHMYANLRLHGGTNHILGIPTGLLQRHFENSTESVFYGGIIRVERSTLPSLNRVYPGDYTSQMSERSRQFMIAGGHTSRNFNPMLTAVTSSEAPWLLGGGEEFVRYTVPAHEFRRILQVARENQEDFAIDYTQLFGHGDEEWRATALGRSIRLVESGNGTMDCRSDSGRCTPQDIPLLPPLPYWARKTLLFEPYPILPGNYKLHCFGP